LPSRRTALRTIAAASLLSVRPALSAPADSIYAGLERTHKRRLGLYALDTGSGREVAYRADERFAFCSTFKAILSGAILARDTLHPGLLAQRIVYASGDLVPNSPITKPHAGAGMTVADLCAAAIEYSDNTAGNLLLELLGGPPALTAYARGLGNRSFRSDRYETELNTAIPGDPRDASTPADMGRTLRALLLGDALTPPARAQLRTWMQGNTLGDRRIRAGVPAGWTVADKTGTGERGSANDLGVVWPPSGAPIVLAVYTTSGEPHANWDDELVAKAARNAIDQLRG
jgi:beta-lactamase class A